MVASREIMGKLEKRLTLRTAAVLCPVKQNVIETCFELDEHISYEAQAYIHVDVFPHTNLSTPQLLLIDWVHFDEQTNKYVCTQEEEHPASIHPFSFAKTGCQGINSEQDFTTSRRAQGKIYYYYK